MAVLAPALSSELLEKRDAARMRHSNIYSLVLSCAGILTTTLILAVILTILIRGLPAINWEFLSSAPAEGMSAGGIWPMIRGSLLLLAGTLVLVLPFGILGGICLAEYATDNVATRVLRACVVSLAGTPSVVYGLFGFAVFVLLCGFGFSLIAGWLTLALFSLPVIVFTTETALKAVPETFVEAGYGLGLSKWQVIRRIILPSALPGLATGIVLATGRAAGEAPPILLTAGIYYSTAKLRFDWHVLKQPVANLPYHLAEGYRQGGVIPEKIIWGTCLVLMLLVLFINLAAIIVRASVRRRQQW